MMKRFLSLVVALMLLSSLFVFEASAESSITLELLNGKVGTETYNSTYSPYTLPGTAINAKSVATLAAGQEVAYFLNGKEVSRATNAGAFAFTSVEGKNIFQAKIMEGGNVVASSNVIEMNFTPLMKNGSDIYTYDLSSLDASKLYYGAIGSSATYVADPTGESRNVTKISLPAGATSAPCNTDIPRSDFYSSQTGISASGIIRADYKIYIENTNTNITLGAIVVGCGCNHTALPVCTDWPSARMKQGTRSGPLAKNKWLDVSIVVDNNRKVYDVSVGGVQAVTAKPICTNASHADANKYLKRIFLAKTAPRKTTTTNEAGETVETYVMSTYYMKDAKIYKCVEPGISISASCKDAKVVAGSKVLINAESTYENANVVYYCNGIKYTDNSVVASAGTNTVYAEAYGPEGNLLATTDEITFEAYTDEFTTAYTANYLANYERKITGASSSIADEHEEFADDEKHGSVIKLSSYKGEEEAAASVNTKTNRRPFVGIEDMERLYVNSIDVYIDKLSDNGFGIAPTFYVNKVNGSARVERWPGLFSFSPDGTLSIVTELQSNFVTASKSKKIPYNKGQWYNIKVVYDPMYGSYALMVDDVVQSVLDTSATMGDATNDCSPTLNGYNANANFLYFDMTLHGSSGESDANVVYLDNYQAGYSKVPTGHSKIDYINNAKLVKARNEITANDDLTVKFVATKGDYANVLCIATVLENNGELVSLATDTVSFDEATDSVPVTLTLRDLPSSIANGNYTVNVMLWDAATQKPIVTKTVLN